MPSDFFGLSGRVIDGQFHVLEVAGEGGFSVVYRGQHLTMREPIAIKVLKFTHKDEEVIASFKQRFFDESRIMYRLSQGNLNIVRAITTGVTVAPTTGSEVPYMVLEWLEGAPLSKVLKELRTSKGPGWPLEKLVRVFEPAALAIAHAHNQGVVHRDIKPGNLFLQSGSPATMKVLDFGMAKIVSPEAMGGIESAQTVAGVMVMSPQYVTPEQLDKAYGTIGPWTDVYAFALILVEALTARRARDAETFVDLMRQIIDDKKAPTPRSRGAIVPATVDKVFARAFARNPADRFQDMSAFWSELKAAVADMEEHTSVDKAPNFSSTLVMPASRPSQPHGFGQTLPLRSMSPVPFQSPTATPPESVARSMSPVPGSFQPPPQAPASHPRMPMPAPEPEPESEPELDLAPVVAPKSGGRGVWVTFLVLFILASLGASAFVLLKLGVLRL